MNFKQIHGLSYSDGYGNNITRHGNQFHVGTKDGRNGIFDSFLKCMNFINLNQ